jgi:CheY-like chemotaxis protein
MGFKFCWEVKNCEKDCPVKEREVLFCWHTARAEGIKELSACEVCNYRQMWIDGVFTVEGFIKRSERRQSPRTTKKILVIDDEPYILYALEETVRAKGLECIAATDGEEGFALAKGLKPDLIITDVIMPKIDGVELCRLLKNDSETSNIPVIMVTVRAMNQDQLQARQAGADDYIIKPFHAHDLSDKIDSFLNITPE